MLTPSQQAVYRPLVDRAWANQCAMSGVPVKDKLSRQVWYRDLLKSRFGIASTKDANPSSFSVLVKTFECLAQAQARPARVIDIDSWTPSQNAVIRRLAGAAWRKESDRGNVRGTVFDSWFNGLAEKAGLFTLKQVGESPGLTHVASDKTHSFDKLVETLAILAGDERWMRRTSEANETRLRFLIKGLLEKLSLLEGHPVDWAYVRGCYDQARLLPEDITDATAESLFKVFQMLDTHSRRLKRRCRRAAGGQQEQSPKNAPVADPRQAAPEEDPSEGLPF